MNIKAVLKLTAPVIITVGLAMLACCLVGLFYDENIAPLAISGLLSTFFGFFMAQLVKDANTRTIGVKEGCLIVTLAWIFACLFGALPFVLMGIYMPELKISFTKAVYETVSGFTTTGSSIFSDVEVLPKNILFWRSLTHWFGGMGIVVFAIAILPAIGVGGMQAFRMESPGPLKTDKLVPRISDTAKILYTVYLAITIIELIALKIVGISLFDAFIHTFGTVGTGGFSNYNTSVAGLQNVYAEYIITFFMWLSGANFGLTYLALWKGDLRGLWKDEEFRVYTLLTIISISLITLILTLSHYQEWNVFQAFRYAAFQVATIFTTTGFATNDFNLWPVSAIAVLIPLMFIGGSTGSTGGGLKVLRHIISFKYIGHEIKKIVRPNLVSTVKVGGRPIDQGIVNSVMVLIAVYLLIFFFCAFVLTFFDMDLVTAFTASIANLGNIGPGLNLVGPAANYGWMPTPALWILSFEMLLGRLEVFTVLVLFVPYIWRKKA